MLITVSHIATRNLLSSRFSFSLNTSQRFFFLVSQYFIAFECLYIFAHFKRDSVLVLIETRDS